MADMEDSTKQDRPGARPLRRTLRLTFEVAGGEARLLKSERLDMICPPSVGESPVAGKNGGYWMELQDREGHPLFHRVLDNPVGDSVEVHSPDGKIERVFGEVPSNVFEVLLPDDDRAQTIVFMGESLTPLAAQTAAVEGATELARFDVPK